MKATLIGTAFLSLSLGAAHAFPTIEVKSSIGSVLASEASGMTLYTFRKDRRGRSNCTGSCAEVWPPYLVGTGTTVSDGFRVILRPDGVQQWATPSGMPLYFWAGDSAPGDASGDGVGGLWDAARR